MFEPEDKPIDPAIWKPSKDLASLAMRRCSWVNCNQINEITSPDEWLAAVIVGAYYQGLADGIKHMAKKQRAAEQKGQQGMSDQPKYETLKYDSTIQTHLHPDDRIADLQAQLERERELQVAFKTEKDTAEAEALRLQGHERQLLAALDDIARDPCREHYKSFCNECNPWKMAREAAERVRATNNSDPVKTERLPIPEHQRIGQAIVNALTHGLGFSNERVHQALFYIENRDLIRAMTAMRGGERADGN